MVDSCRLSKSAASVRLQQGPEARALSIEKQARTVAVSVDSVWPLEFLRTKYFAAGGGLKVIGLPEGDGKKSSGWIPMSDPTAVSRFWTV